MDIDLMKAWILQEKKVRKEHIRKFLFSSWPQDGAPGRRKPHPKILLTQSNEQKNEVAAKAAPKKETNEIPQVLHQMDTKKRN